MRKKSQFSPEIYKIFLLPQDSLTESEPARSDVFAQPLRQIHRCAGVIALRRGKVKAQFIFVSLGYRKTAQVCQQNYGFAYKRIIPGVQQSA